MLKIIASLVRGSCRNFAKDSNSLIQGIQPPVRFIARENIPDNELFLVTLNHYSRPGFQIIWAAAALSTALPGQVIWLMTSAWTNRTGGFDRLRSWLTRVVFARVAEIYAFITTPPIPSDIREAPEKLISLRRLDRLLRENPNAVLCLAPEGRDFEGGIIGEVPRGTGKFIRFLLKRLKRILPVGVYESDGGLVVNFGEPYSLEEQNAEREDDEGVIHQVMARIAALLPENLRGNYAVSQEIK